MIPRHQASPGLTAAQFLLKPGRKYEEAAKAFGLYDRTQQTNYEARFAGRTLIACGRSPKNNLPGGGRTFIYVNNRLEGNALETIAAMVGDAGR